ncbi:MAG TPA: AarF/ABC1/UbiB kinase family protein [Polyangiaceae bacterium]|nr:AarF/ABC1/UbiB kinase family protein [Polyangiaceae bacterium]
MPPDNGRKLPTGRLKRLVRMAGVGARTGAGFVLSKSGVNAAEYAAEVLGSLRGLAAKVGQTLSYVDGLVPEAQRESYERALGKLRDSTPRSSATAIRQVVEEELGGPIERLFASFDPEPFASASIGQVHRARLPDGRAVAVKVQHPGIATAVESDLKNAGIAEGLIATFAPKGVDPKAAYDEVAKRFREELDYELEAEHQRAFAAFHAGDPKISIPGVIDDRSARRVLTSELSEGLSLEQATALSEAERRAWAETLWRFVFKGNLVFGMFNADPHPGNYLFRPDGAVTFLDFGCVQPIVTQSLGPARAMHRSAVARDEKAFAEAAQTLLGTRGGEYGTRAIAYVRRCFAPMFESPFHISREYTTGLFTELREMKKLMWAKDGSFVMLPPSMLFLNRLQFGFYSVLARLDVTTDYAAVERKFLGEAGLL